jgi:hypothetical protein
MRHLYSLVRPLAAGLAIVFLALADGCSKPADNGTVGTGLAAVPSSIAQVKTASKLGDLTAFRSIAADIAIFVDKGAPPAAKTRIKDLEVAWDSAEAGMKPRAADEWHVLDKSIDHALSALRADTPNQAGRKKVMAELLKNFDSLQGKI